MLASTVLSRNLLPSVYAGLLTACVTACGSSPSSLGESSQPINAAEDGAHGAADQGGTDPAPDAEEPIDSTAACALGSPTPRDPGLDCQAVANGSCFGDAATACACLGCESDRCATLETFPAQAFCLAPQPGDDADGNVSSGPIGGGVSGAVGSGASQPGSAACTPAQTQPAAPGAGDGTDGLTCNFVVDGACFEDGATACAAAGCADDGCLVLESYPAQIACQP